MRFTCENCGAEAHRPGNPRGKLTPRTCSRKCLGILQSRERKGVFGVGEKNGYWRGGIQTYRRFRKEACEQCSSQRFLVVHHRDENRYNNDPSNLETLCKSCHQRHHLIRGSDGRYIGAAA